jgi:hypothetical protein
MASTETLVFPPKAVTEYLRLEEGMSHSHTYTRIASPFDVGVNYFHKVGAHLRCTKLAEKIPVTYFC